jgi:uncharacterized protein (DUF1499 family)
MLKILLAIVLIPIVLYALAALTWGREGLLDRLFGPIVREPVEFATLQLRPTPNQYLVCPAGYCSATPHAESPVFDVPADKLRQAWFRVIERQPRVKLISSDAGNSQFDLEARTPVLLFPDTVTVRFIALGESQSTLAIYSRSHYGHSDLGVNKNRITQWLAELGKEVRK